MILCMEKFCSIGISETRFLAHRLGAVVERGVVGVEGRPEVLPGGLPLDGGPELPLRCGTLSRFQRARWPGLDLGKGV